MTPREALERAIALAEGQTALAGRCGQPDKPVKQAHVWNWLNRDGGRVPSEYAIPVSRAVGFEVTPHQLRPDIYPNETDGLPSAESAA